MNKDEEDSHSGSEISDSETEDNDSDDSTSGLATYDALAQISQKPKLENISKNDLLEEDYVITQYRNSLQKK